MTRPEQKHVIHITDDAPGRGHADCKCGWSTETMDVSTAMDEADEHLIQMARMGD